MITLQGMAEFLKCIRLLCGYIRLKKYIILMNFFLFPSDAIFQAFSITLRLLHKQSSKQLQQTGKKHLTKNKNTFGNF